MSRPNPALQAFSRPVLARIFRLTRSHIQILQTWACTCPWHFLNCRSPWICDCDNPLPPGWSLPFEEPPPIWNRSKIKFRSEVFKVKVTKKKENHYFLLQLFFSFAISFKFFIHSKIQGKIEERRNESCKRLSFNSATFFYFQIEPDPHGLRSSNWKLKVSSRSSHHHQTNKIINIPNNHFRPSEMLFRSPPPPTFGKNVS